MCMTDFAEQLTKEYESIYARAAYRNLLRSENRPFSIHFDDLQKIMSPLRFSPVANVAIESGGEKLVQILSSCIREIPGENFYHFFRLDENDTIFSGADSSSSASLDNSTGNDDDDDISRSSDGTETKQGVETTVNPDKEEETDSGRARPPIFVRFLLDGTNASMEDLKHFRKCVNLVALISLYDEESQSPMNLPLSHRTPASHIKRLLDAYVAEQSLERLRHHGRTIRPEDLRLARKCLRRARDVLTSAVVLLFYSSTLDSLVSASAPAGNDSDIVTGMQLLQEELLRFDELRLGRMNDGSFVVFGRETDSELLPYWCFLDFANGFVSIETYHPAGPDAARNLLSSVHAVLMERLHRVNASLILRRLHKHRTASTLMIPRDDIAPVEEDRSGKEEDQPATGFFACPVVFRKRFELFHRCATNPEQVARTVETSVLHVFSLSNRRRVFVYKDESGNIFYMKLSTTGGGLEPDGVIDLEVHGIEQPTESVTKQLSRLISKKILSIAVDLLSAVLTKNPRYGWRNADVNFVIDYNKMLIEVEEDTEGFDPSVTQYYSLPLSTSDPSSVLLYFRQNLCGSTYFHPFIASSARDEGTDEIAEPRFMFYYNNIPSKLSPKLQVWSTLTKKGAEFARSAGQGLALVEVSLVDSSGNPHAALQPREDLAVVTSDPSVSDDSIKVRFEEKLERSSDIWIEQGRLPTHFVKVTVTDTALKRNVLHAWIQLTLNQAAAGWFIEKQLERQQRGLLRSSIGGTPPLDSNEAKQNMLIDEVSPGLPALLKMYQTAHDLPHPGIRRMEFDGVVRASSVASVALKLLELVIDPIKKETKGSSDVDFVERINVIRLSRGGKPKFVRLSWNQDKRTCFVHLLKSSPGKAIVDSHIDCPHYLISFCSPEYTVESKQDKFLFPKLFEGVNVEDDYKSETRLAALKRAMPSTFMRSFGFVLSVTRNR